MKSLNSTKKVNKNKINKILIFFNNFRGLDLSNFLLKKNYKIFNIVTRKFLNRKILPNLKKNFRFIKNLKSKKLVKFIKKEKFDLIISAGFPHLFKEEYFKLAPHGIINLHAGRLPKYRGGSPLVWQVLNNEKQIGLSIIKINKKIDSGKIISSSSFFNKKNYTINDIQIKSNKIFCNLTLDAIKKLNNNKKLKNQKKSISYFKQRSSKDAFIDFNKTNLEIFNLVRAQSFPYKGAFFYNNKKKFRIIKCLRSKISPNLKYGTIFKFKGKKKMFIKCKTKSIMIEDIKPNFKTLKNIKII